MNKLLAIFLITISTMATSEEITFADVQLAQETNPDLSLKLIGGVQALVERCDVKLTVLGDTAVELINYNGIESNYFFQEGQAMVNEKVDNFGCWVSKFVAKKHVIGKYLFN